MFKGRYNHAVDGKGRASLPSKFREVVTGFDDDRVVVTYALDKDYPHLDVYPYTVWRDFEEKLASKPMFDKNVRYLKLLYVANAIECQIDGHGRILIPSSHRDYADIGKDVVWVGMNRIVELWQPGRWSDAEKEARSLISEVREGLSNFEL